MAAAGGIVTMREDRASGTTAVIELLRAGASAPSSHNSQPWRLQWHHDAVEVHGDPDRRLEVADPDARELRLACGAALLNVRLAVRAQGRRAHTQLLPDPADRWFLGRVRPGSVLPASLWESELATAIPRRHTDRHPFDGRPLPAALRDQLARAAGRESCRLVFLTDARQRRELRELTARAHRQQRADPAFVAEWERWIGHPAREDDGLPREHAQRAPRADSAWRPRDFGDAVADTDRTAPPTGSGDDPTVAVVLSYDDGPLAHLRAGAAMQQVLLTATAHGVGSSFVAPPLEVAAVRDEVRALLGGVLWPQVVLRLGWGRPVHPTPRRRDTGA
ncbi:Acg family FMN-binding oxidoreductase [Actinomycetospora straminea]|uniref:Nitroreductase family protein n=1 Tax=Actinomycetospora straminea TaxID=663607 RepID=A0ABP9ETJ5_9PSEU|nr:nitroreductase family protein [Actinomycetospora straminea]MDD7933212.1 nitroreductase family protein [Actinomycetospora straminea]